ncbi:MAG: peptide chain release factor N(5)-glutamine methyltransferase [Muribaculaceae bacterium]|nr:peptide chain release factor N(5)-glutamine methyltransferase [Muribaculaceae bacterium]
MTTVAQYFKALTARLSQALGSQAEGEAAARILLEDVAGYDRRYIFMNGDREMTDYMQAKVDAVAAKVESGEPVQYAVGSARFMGNDFKVTPAVLVPRPETAGLVDAITDRYGSQRDLAVLDVGTGSGCIAISLAKALPFSRVTAVDVSAEALAVARDNASGLGADVTFECLDILKAEPAREGVYDIVVSNPPYICEEEKKEMDARVLAYEPATALFVPDSDPLVFYRAIARYAKKALRPGGRLYFEINSRFPQQMQQMLAAEGYSDIDITRDYRGLYRYAVAVR